MIITKETEMTAIPKITFKEFASNPIVALLFLSVCATGALWYQNKVTLENHIAEYRKEVSILKKENRDLQEKYIQVLVELKSLNQ